MSALGGPWSPVLPDGAELCRYTDPEDACSRAREESRRYGRVQVVDGLRGPRRTGGELPRGVRVVAVYEGGVAV